MKTGRGGKGGRPSLQHTHKVTDGEYHPPDHSAPAHTATLEQECQPTWRCTLFQALSCGLFSVMLLKLLSAADTKELLTWKHKRRGEREGGGEYERMEGAEYNM